MSVCTAGLPKSTHSAPPVHELLPLSETLPRVGIALCCIWATYTTTLLPQGKASAAGPLQAVVLASAPCKVVVPSNILSPGHGSTVEPPEVAALAAEPPEVSVVSVCELSSCPVTAKKAACELSSCPVMAKKAACELSSCPVTAMEAVHELSPCPVTAKEAVYELSPCPVTAKKAAYELSPCPVRATKKAEVTVSSRATPPDTIKALPVLSVSVLPLLSVSALPVLFVLVLLCLQVLSGLSVQSAPPWWVLVPSVPPWWVPGLSALLWWVPVPSAPPRRVTVLSARPWWAPVPSAPPWGAPVPSALPWWAPVPSSPPCLPHGPGPPSLPLFHLRSTAHLDLCRSVWKPLLGGGGGYVTNRGHEHCFTHHQMSLFHHRTFTQLQITLRLHFPSFTAPTQLFTIITLAPVHYHPITHTLYKP